MRGGEPGKSLSSYSQTTCCLATSYTRSETIVDINIDFSGNYVASTFQQDEKLSGLSSIFLWTTFTEHLMKVLSAWLVHDICSGLCKRPRFLEYRQSKLLFFILFSNAHVCLMAFKDTPNEFVIMKFFVRSKYLFDPVFVRTICAWTKPICYGLIPNTVIEAAMAMRKKFQAVRIVSTILLILLPLLAHAQFGVVTAPAPTAPPETVPSVAVAPPQEAPTQSPVIQGLVAAPVTAVTLTPVVAPVTASTSAPTEAIDSAVIDVPAADNGFGGSTGEANATIEGQDYAIEFVWRLYSDSMLTTVEGANTVKTELEARMNGPLVDQAELPEGTTIDAGTLDTTVRGAYVCDWMHV